MADFHHANRDDPALDGEEVEVTVARPLSITMSFRLPQNEALAIRAAVEASGTTLSEWIRAACTDALASGKPPAKPAPGLGPEQARRLLAALEAAEAVVRPAAKAGWVSGSASRGGRPR
ncbi:hypothetical protein F1721_15305 [Saccharopolyspora hirsuta]|uniref:Uncharacterized protein n=1 Tax=Saccharopolyspora hirsuta TaxID=1837 RepID=A0A5M7BW21_SACHI|nr:hypothetical protein [Saccharopolyspora hirsuta]KAA5833633.1 hypothetical protein F1721_15305 [Saccharopolyspora hirsuta]